MLVEALLLGGVPNPVLNLNASAADIALALAGGACAPTSRVLGFVGWQTEMGIVRGISAFDQLLFAQPDFIAQPAPVRSHISDEAARLAQAASVEESAATCSPSAVADNNGQCDATPIRGPDDPTRVHYDPSHDDDGCFQTKQGDNNCYNYGTDVLTNTFAQPGRGSGVCGHHDRPCVPNTCDDVRKAAISDGLLDAGTQLPAALPARGHYVSLHIWPKSNFHWLRMSADKTWSHKPGGSKVRNVDNNGHTITDPAKADVSPWSTHCGYLLALPSNVTIY